MPRLRRKPGGAQGGHAHAEPRKGHAARREDCVRERGGREPGLGGGQPGGGGGGEGSQPRIGGRGTHGRYLLPPQGPRPVLERSAKPAGSVDGRLEPQPDAPGRPRGPAGAGARRGGPAGGGRDRRGRGDADLARGDGGRGPRRGRGVREPGGRVCGRHPGSDGEGDGEGFLGVVGEVEEEEWRGFEEGGGEDAG